MAAASAPGVNPNTIPNSFGAAIQMPVGANPEIFNGLLQSLQQALGNLKIATTSDTAPHNGMETAAAGTVGVPTSVTAPGPNGSTLTEAGYVSPVLLQGFSNSLFEALQASGLGGGDATVTPAAAGSSAAAINTGYQSALASSLQSLIQQLRSNGTGSAATSTLETSFDNMMQGSGIAVTNGSTSSNGTPQPSSLQIFLNSLLANSQSGATSSTGMNVNTSV